ncbi:unnamed protein product [Orchesella dallaii]|uniref:Uncharacterized protein n=1 Tax=Orchesella dallaii TaxID=48710 RepID=A0ABP1QU59_9HEXA
MDVEANRVVIVPSSNQSITSPTPKPKPLGSATRFDWKNYDSQPQPQHTESETRVSQIRRNSLNQRKLARKTVLCYRLADLVMVMLLIFPLAIAFWRGVWQLMEYHSVQWGIDPWLSMGVGYSIPFILHVVQEPLKRTVCLEKMSFPLFYVLSRAILLIHSFGSVNQWRGLWAWMDIFFGVDDPWSAIITMIIGIVFLVVLKTLNNVLAPPLFCFVDESRSIHDCTLRFKTSTKNKCQYLLDCVFSVIIIPAFVVFCWRGLWTLADIYLYPDDETKSAMASLGVGYFICIILCLTQPWICRTVKNLKGGGRLVFMDLIYLVGFIGCVLAWRGVWNSYNIFFAFEQQNLSEWITTVVGAFGTMMLGCISVVVVRGVAIDGEMLEDGTGEWLIPYISVINSPVYDVPYPEPWICRYFCTTQKLGKNRRQAMKDSKLGDNASVLDGTSDNPMKRQNSNTNSVHPAPAIHPKSQQHAANNPRFRLSDLPNIDSSSEEELGMRTMMGPPSPDDVNSNNKNELKEQDEHQTV